MPFKSNIPPLDQSPHKPDAEPDITASLARLKDFRASWNEDDEIGESSRLSARDLDVVIGWVEQHIGA